MRTFLKVVVMTATLAACADSTPPDTVESLAADPTRLHALLRQCREAWHELGEAKCAMAHEAWRRRFVREGRARYTPQD